MATEDTDIKKQFSLQEFVVDFFGALMPGVLFLFFLIPSIFYSAYVSLMILVNLVSTIKVVTAGALLLHIKNLPSVTIIAGFVLFLAIGYVIGTLFYRRDPKWPDYRSFLKIASRFKSTNVQNTTTELISWVVKVKIKNDEDIDGCGSNLMYI